MAHKDQAKVFWGDVIIILMRNYTKLCKVWGSLSQMCLSCNNFILVRRTPSTISLESQRISECPLSSGPEEGRC